MNDEAKKTITRDLAIHGLVQGVGFRWSLCMEARSLGVAGWVRNCRDGSVAARVRGAEAAVAALVAWAHNGPPAARVTRVEVAAGDDGEALAGFEQRATE